MEWPTLVRAFREMALIHPPYSSRPPAIRCLPPLSPGRDALLKGSILGLSGPIDKKPADEPCTRPGSRTEPGVPAYGAKNGAHARARGGAGERSLLGRRHICAGGKRPSEGREQQ
jgi:hypothetical protein